MSTTTTEQQQGETWMHELIAGALFDFMGRLTTLDEPLTLSGKHEPHRLLDVFGEWASERRLNTHDADVRRWHLRIGLGHTPASAGPDATARDDNWE
jgi:hypothetical protein